MVSIQQSALSGQPKKLTTKDAMAAKASRIFFVPFAFFAVKKVWLSADC
jgi:hypothetical protein